MNNRRGALAKEESYEVESYQFIRGAIGLVSMILPFATILPAVLYDKTSFDSISATYYTRSRNLLVGSLCALGIMFLSYRRNARRTADIKDQEYRIDGHLSFAAGISALTVALFPTGNCENSAQPQRCPGFWSVRGGLATGHAVATGILMVTIAVFCLRQFVRTNDMEPRRHSLLGRLFGQKPKTQRGSMKRKRNVIFRTCGALIVGCVIWIATLNLRKILTDDRISPDVRFPESIAVTSFAVAWLTKSGWHIGSFMREDPLVSGNAIVTSKLDPFLATDRVA
jgi:hypothetical protein